MEDIGDFVDGRAFHGDIASGAAYFGHLAAPAVLYIKRGKHIAYPGPQGFGGAAGEDEVLVFLIMTDQRSKQLVF
ncbi:MAG: hypothetical protein IKJ95_06085 [Bacteroidaceae bacterium]|nr:hypothetical protein [Bacteroidaceae bacterium]